MITYRHMKAEKHLVIEPVITYRHIVWITHWSHSHGCIARNATKARKQCFSNLKSTDWKPEVKKGAHENRAHGQFVSELNWYSDLDSGGIPKRPAVDIRRTVMHSQMFVAQLVFVAQWCTTISDSSGQPKIYYNGHVCFGHAAGIKTRCVLSECLLHAQIHGEGGRWKVESGR